jgi:hypothetical protein
MSSTELLSGRFWLATLERAVRAFAASLASLLTASGTGILDTDWGQKFAVAAMAAVVAVLLAVAGGTFGSGSGPSFAGAETTDAAPPPPPPPPPPSGSSTVPSALGGGSSQL